MNKYYFMNINTGAQFIVEAPDDNVAYRQLTAEIKDTSVYMATYIIDESGTPLDIQNIDKLMGVKRNTYFFVHKRTGASHTIEAMNYKMAEKEMNEHAEEMDEDPIAYFLDMAEDYEGNSLDVEEIIKEAV